MPTRARVPPVLLLIGIQMMSGMRETPLFTFLGIYLHERAWAATAAYSALVAAALLAGALAALAGGWLVERFGARRVLLAGITVSMLHTFVYDAPGLWILAALWLAGSFGGALASVGGSSYLTLLSSRGVLGMRAALYAFSMTLGGAFGSPLAGALIASHGYIVFGRVASGMAVLALLCAAAIPDARSEPQPRGAAAGKRGTAWFGRALPLLRHGTTLRLLVLRSLPTLFYGAMLVLIPLQLNALTGDKLLVAAYGTTSQLCASAAQLIVGRAADRFGARVPSLISFGVLVAAGLGLGAGAHSAHGLFVFGVMGISAAWALSTLSFVWVSDGVARTQHATVFGLIHAVWSLSMIGGSALAGVAAQTGLAVPMLAAGALNVISLFAIQRFYRDRVPQP